MSLSWKARDGEGGESGGQELFLEGEGIGGGGPPKWKKTGPVFIPLERNRVGCFFVFVFSRMHVALS